MKHTVSNNKAKKNLSIGSQRGMASIVVTTVLIAVIGLLIIGFSLIARRNQKETLDRQLTTQAYYAAETGVNDVRSRAAQAILGGVAVLTQSTCTEGNYPLPVLGNGVEVTCLTVLDQLKTLEYGAVNDDQDTFVPVIASVAGTQIAKINLVWSSSSGVANPLSTCGDNGLKLPANSAWGACEFGLIRADVVRSTDTFARTVYLIPNASGVSAIPLDAVGRVSGASCDSSLNRCSMTLDVSGLGALADRYYLRVRSLYRPAKLAVSAEKSDGTPITLSGQLQIDSTGKAQDVLRRIQVRVPISPGAANNPFGAIDSSQNVCKRFVVAPGYFTGGGDNGICQ